MTDDGLDRAGGAYRLERALGVVAGISVEIWKSTISGDVELVVFPSVEGVKTILRGGMAEITLLTNMGEVLLRALEGLVPLLTGDWFRAPQGVIN